MWSITGVKELTQAQKGRRRKEKQMNGPCRQRRRVESSFVNVVGGSLAQYVRCLPHRRLQQALPPPAARSANRPKRGKPRRTPYNSVRNGCKVRRLSEATPGRSSSRHLVSGCVAHELHLSGLSISHVALASYWG